VQAGLWTEAEAGLFLVTYRAADHLSPAKNQPLVTRMKDWASAQQRRAAVIFDVGPQIGWVDLNVPSFWLGVTGAADCPIFAMGIVTRAAGVRVAATGFALANLVRKIDLTVEVFNDTAGALAWARAKLLVGAGARAGAHDAK
jgi:hypothetical protein